MNSAAAAAEQKQTQLSSAQLQECAAGAAVKLRRDMKSYRVTHSYGAAAAIAELFIRKILEL